MLYRVSIARGVMRLDGTRGKKQVWRPHVRTCGLSETNVLFKKSICDIVGIFSAPSVIRRRGNDSAQCTPLAPPRYASEYGHPHPDSPSFLKFFLSVGYIAVYLQWQIG